MFTLRQKIGNRDENVYKLLIIELTSSQAIAKATKEAGKCSECVECMQSAQYESFKRHCCVRIEQITASTASKTEVTMSEKGEMKQKATLSCYISSTAQSKTMANQGQGKKKNCRNCVTMLLISRVP